MAKCGGSGATISGKSGLHSTPNGKSLRRKSVVATRHLAPGDKHAGTREPTTRTVSAFK
jgi:hypothetical protein